MSQKNDFPVEDSIKRVLALADEMDRAADDYPVDEVDAAVYRVLTKCAERIREAVYGD